MPKCISTMSGFSHGEPSSIHGSRSFAYPYPLSASHTFLFILSCLKVRKKKDFWPWLPSISYQLSWKTKNLDICVCPCQYTIMVCSPNKHGVLYVYPSMLWLESTINPHKSMSLISLRRAWSFFVVLFDTNSTVDILRLSMYSRNNLLFWSKRSETKLHSVTLCTHFQSCRWCRSSTVW